MGAAVNEPADARPAAETPETPQTPGTSEAAELATELAAELAAARERIAHLEIALQTNRRIAMAIGILMARRGLTEDAAFGELRAASQRRAMKVRELAGYVVEAGDLSESQEEEATG